MEINILKTEVKHLQTASKDIKYLKQQLSSNPHQAGKETEQKLDLNKQEPETSTSYLLLVNQVTFQK
ncbi:unnamed protein product [Camellia sinensis]